MFYVNLHFSSIIPRSCMMVTNWSSCRHGRPQKVFQRGATSTFCLFFLVFWWCSANGCSQNAL